MGSSGEKQMAVVEDNIKHVTRRITTMMHDTCDMAAHTTKKKFFFLMIQLYSLKPLKPRPELQLTA